MLSFKIKLSGIIILGVNYLTKGVNTNREIEIPRLKKFFVNRETALLVSAESAIRPK